MQGIFASKESVSDILSNGGGGTRYEGGGVLTSSRSGRTTLEPEVKVDAKLAHALNQISARTFQTILSKRY
jgi:hypothetical protein